jgi:hypothetical protein
LRERHHRDIIVAKTTFHPANVGSNSSRLDASPLWHGGTLLIPAPGADSVAAMRLGRILCPNSMVL